MPDLLGVILAIIWAFLVVWYEFGGEFFPESPEEKKVREEQGEIPPPSWTTFGNTVLVVFVPVAFVLLILLIWQWWET